MINYSTQKIVIDPKGFCSREWRTTPFISSQSQRQCCAQLASGPSDHSTWATKQSQSVTQMYYHLASYSQSYQTELKTSKQSHHPFELFAWRGRKHADSYNFNYTYSDRSFCEGYAFLRQPPVEPHWMIQGVREKITSQLLTFFFIKKMLLTCSAQPRRTKQAKT